MHDNDILLHIIQFKTIQSPQYNCILGHHIDDKTELSLKLCDDNLKFLFISAFIPEKRKQDWKYNIIIIIRVSMDSISR